MRYTTSNERTFLSKLGQNKHSTCVRSSRTFLLLQYIQSCAHRIRWGDISKLKIIIFAKQQLKEEREGVTNNDV